MDKNNLNVSHLAWCGLVALHTARHDGLTGSAAQDNLFLVRWLAQAEKQRRFSRELAGDISWLLKEGRGKGLQADQPGKLNYLWRAGNGNLEAQSEWSGRRQLRLNPAVSGIYLNRSAPDVGFDEKGRQRITGELPGLDALLSRSGWRRVQVPGDDALLFHLMAEGFRGA